MASEADRVRKALTDAGHQKGWRGLKPNEQGHVELSAGDILALARSVPEPSQTVADLLMAAQKHRPDRNVTIYSDHAFELLEAAEAAQPKAPEGKAEEPSVRQRRKSEAEG